MFVEFWKDRASYPAGGQVVDVPESTLRVAILSDTDKSDPLDKVAVVVLRAGKFSAKARATERNQAGLNEALTALVSLALDRATEIKEALV